jgi:hypothetical protein
MKKHHLLLVELIQLKETDYDKFMDKLYIAMTTEFSNILRDELLKDEEHKNTLKSMISYFENKEEYEKCDVLLHYLRNAD